MGPPTGGAALALWLGVVCMILAFAGKQLAVDLSLSSAGNMLESDRLQAERAVELRAVDTELDDIDLEIAALDVPGAKPDDGKLADLRKKRVELNEKLEVRRQEIRRAYQPRIRAAERASGEAKATGLSSMQTALWMKLFLDFMRLVGATLVVLAALRITFDDTQKSGAKAYACVLGGIAFVSIAIGGLYTLLG